MADLDRLDEQIAALESSLGGAEGVAAAFNDELRRMQATVADTGRDVGELSRGISRGLRGAFDGLVFDGLRLRDAMRQVGQSMLDAAYAAAIKPVARHMGAAMAGGMEGLVRGLLPFANGGGFAQGRVMPFAHGGIVGGPVAFPMRGGWGLMGEAGPEAIMPLTRGADGKLGVRAEGGGRPVTVVMNISTPDAEGFRRSHSQIAAQMTRALSRGTRNR
ncbi:MAG: phage tail tape measure protein [Rhodobacteraceae bacterium]|nr:phage tail tape measure protein [Paracoccaceae bacterium]